MMIVLRRINVSWPGLCTLKTRRLCGEVLRVGDAAEETRRFSARDVDTFAAVSGDRNPLHMKVNHDDGRFSGRVVHGVLLLRSVTLFSSRGTHDGSESSWFRVNMCRVLARNLRRSIRRGSAGVRGLGPRKIF